MVGMTCYRALTIGFVSGELDQRVRLAAFQWLRAQMDVHGEVLPRSVLAEGFVFDGRRVPLLGPQGTSRFDARSSRRRMGRCCSTD
jgi:hypothetical protein